MVAAAHHPPYAVPSDRAGAGGCQRGPVPAAGLVALCHGRTPAPHDRRSSGGLNVCGIWGQLHFQSRLVLDPDTAQAMGAALVHRGPDEGGHWAGEGIALGMRRLSIIDLEGG